MDEASDVRYGAYRARWALLSLAGSIYLVLLLRFNCRIFLRHYPKELRKLVPPKSKHEMQMSDLRSLSC